MYYRTLSLWRLSKGMWQQLIHYKNIMDFVHCLRYISLHHVLEVGSASIFRSSNTYQETYSVGYITLRSFLLLSLSFHLRLCLEIKPVKCIEQNVLQYYFYLMIEAEQPSETPVAYIFHTVDTDQLTFCLCKLDSSVWWEESKT